MCRAAVEPLGPSLGRSRLAHRPPAPVKRTRGGAHYPIGAVSCFARRFRYLKCRQLRRRTSLKESVMKSTTTNDRRSFLGRMCGAAAAASLSLVAPRADAAQEGGADDWLKEVK